MILVRRGLFSDCSSRTVSRDGVVSFPEQDQKPSRLPASLLSFGVKANDIITCGNAQQDTIQIGLLLKTSNRKRNSPYKESIICPQ